MTHTSSSSSARSHQHTHRIASVGFINAKPLIWGLERERDVALRLDVPSRLLGLVEAGQCDVGLLPVIDYQKRGDLLIVPAGGIGCDGHTLTVRLFAQRPIDQITTLACDPDSHTSVALARIILAKRYGVRPTLIDLAQATGAPDEARLLIGDKVVCEEPVGFDVQLDLGHAWKELTGLPFVFAVWMARRDVPLGDLPERLARAREQGLANVDAIVKQHAIPRGWPAGIALQYLTVYLKYEIGEPQLRAIGLFHDLAARLGILPHSPRSLRLAGR